MSVNMGEADDDEARFVHCRMGRMLRAEWSVHPRGGI